MCVGEVVWLIMVTERTGSRVEGRRRKAFSVSAVFCEKRQKW